MLLALDRFLILPVVLYLDPFQCPEIAHLIRVEGWQADLIILERVQRLLQVLDLDTLNRILQGAGAELRVVQVQRFVKWSQVPDLEVLPDGRAERWHSVPALILEHRLGDSLVVAPWEGSRGHRRLPDLLRRPGVCCDFVLGSRRLLPIAKCHIK